MTWRNERKEVNVFAQLTSWRRNSAVASFSSKSSIVGGDVCNACSSRRNNRFGGCFLIKPSTLLSSIGISNASGGAEL